MKEKEYTQQKVWFPTGSILICVGFLTLFSHCGRNLQNSERGIELSTVKQNIRKYESPNWEIRQNAIIELNKNITISGNQLIERALMVSSRDSHTLVRIESLKGMAELKSQKASERIREMALNDPNNSVRWYALKILSHNNDPYSLDIFIKSYENDDWLIREASIAGILGYEKATEKEKIVTYALKGLNDPSGSVKIATLLNLKIKDEKLYPPIRELFRSKKNSSHPILNASLMAMKGYIPDAETREDLINLLGHPNSEIRILALRVLKQESIIRSLHDHK